MTRLPVLLGISVASASIGLAMVAPTASAATSPPRHGVVRLTGANEVPGPGDPDGSGTFAWIAKHRKLCYFVSVRNIATATAAHIHTGAAGVAGPIVIGLKTPATGVAYDCIRAVPDEQQTPGNNAMLLTRSELKAIAGMPSRYYANVHNGEFRAGAIRGQLR